MRRFLKLMFSQVAIVSILLIFQLLLIAVSLLRLNEYFVYFDIFLKIISIATVILIINRHSNPTYKIAWIIPILLFPMFGGLFYLFITGQMHTKYFFNKLNTLKEKINSDFPQDEAVMEEMHEKFPERVNTVKYINNVSHQGAYFCGDARYFSTGEEMHKSLLDELEKAEKYIFLEFFIIKEGIMWDSVLEILKRKASLGVDVRVIYDGMGSMTSLPHKYPKKLRSYGIKCCVFSPFTPFLSAIQNNRDHRKIVVIDGKVAYTGGINLADEYINIDYPHGYWKDMAVMVTGEAAFSFARMFLQLWWNTVRKEENIQDFIPEFLPSVPENGIVMPYSDMPQDKYQVGEFIYLDIINKAKDYIYITTPYLILDHEMIVALTNAAYSGVDVRIICPRVADHWYARAVAYSYYMELMEAGVKLYEYTPGFIHGKTFCSDNHIAVVGSINLDFRSLYLHFECAAWFLDSDVVSSVVNDFEETLGQCKVITKESCTRIGFFRKIGNAILRLFAPLM